MKLIYLILCCALSILANAQTAERQVIASTGANHINNGGHQVSYTVGEAIIGTITHSSAAVTQGFHQTNLVGIGVVEAGDLTGLIVYPNPTRSVLHIRLGDTGKKTDLTISIFSLSGQELLKMYHAYNGTIEENIEIDVSQLSMAPYILRIMDVDNGKLSAFWFDKLD